MEDTEEFTIYDISTKCKSKIELYNLLTREGTSISLQFKMSLKSI